MRINLIRSPSFSGLIAVMLAGVFFLPCPLSADSFDWRNVNGQNFTTPAKDQGPYGTCWEFGPSGAFEMKYKLTRNDSVFDPNVSENEATSPNQVMQHYTDQGVESETQWPYMSSGSPYAPGWEDRVWKSVSCQVGVRMDTDAMKACLKTNGSYGVCVDASFDLFGSVADLKANYHTLEMTSNHSVSLVGYYDDPTVPTGGYWVIKNSWSTGWGNNGFGYVPYGALELTGNMEVSTGPVYFTGPMYHTGPWGAAGTDYTGTAATNTWKGTTNGTWDTTAGTSNNWSNNSTHTSFTWVNQELQAVFDNTASNRAITVGGTVIAHGLTFNTGATGYSFSGGSLTVTAGGIQANENVTINSPLYVGGPQSWTVAASKALTINGALHTIISDTTIAGAGDVTVNGAIDGGGVANATHCGAKPGGIIKNSTGALTLASVGNFGGDITVNTGTLNIAPAGGANTIYSGALFGSGATVINSAGVTSIGGGASNYSGAITLLGGGTLQFVPAAGVAGTFSGPDQRRRFRRAKRPRHDHPCQFRQLLLGWNNDHHRRRAAGRQRCGLAREQLPQAQWRRAAKQQCRHFHAKSRRLGRQRFSMDGRRRRLLRRFLRHDRQHRQ